MRLLIVSLGSIGRRHLACLRQLMPAADITVWRQHNSVAGQPVPEGADRAVGSLEEALAAKPEAAIVCGPATTHVAASAALVEAGVHLLVEKPLSDRLDGVADLVRAAAARNVVLMVGYTLRFHPVFRAVAALLAADAVGPVTHLHAEVGQYLPDWRAGADYRTGVSARAELGGGALLELSHEIDTVHALLGRPQAVTARLRRLGDLEIDVEDNVDMILDYASTVATIHVDMLQRAAHRVCRVVGCNGTLEADFIASRIRVFRDGAWTDIPVTPLTERNGLYLAEQQHFLDCVRAGSAPCVSGSDGMAVMDIIEAARRSAAEARTVTLS